MPNRATTIPQNRSVKAPPTLGVGRIMVPSYRHHKASGKAVVTLGGIDRYLGPWRSAESKRAYRQVVAEWFANGQRHAVPPSELTCTELAAAFWTHAETFYRRADGSPVKSSIDGYKQVLAVLRRLYGPTPAADFGPLQLRAVRDSTIAAGLCRRVCNQRTNLLRSVFRWGVGRAMLPPHVLTALSAVEPLKRGRTDAPDHPAVRPVPDAHVEAVLPLLSRQVAALVQLARLTGARCGELCQMRPIDLDTGGAVWLFTPKLHKTQHAGHERAISLGPKAQAIIRPFLANRAVAATLFSPREAEEERIAARGAARKTPLSCGNRPGTNRKPRPRRKPGEMFDALTVTHGIQRACRRIGIPEWHVHQLRHNCATAIRREHGVEMARAVLGHSSIGPTQLYAEIDRNRVAEVVGKVG